MHVIKKRPEFAKNDTLQSALRISWFSVLLIAAASVSESAAVIGAPYLHPPSVETFAKHNPDGVTILSNGRYLKPAGKHFPLARWPYGLAMSRDGQHLFVASEGVGQLLSDWQSDAPRITQLELAHPTDKKKGRSNG